MVRLLGQLVQDAAGDFYGVTTGLDADSRSSKKGGDHFKIDQAGDFTTVYRFCMQGGTNCPMVALGLLSCSLRMGHFYGTNQNGGAYYDGTLFQLNPTGSLKTLVSFDAANDGPTDIAFGGNGSFYGPSTYSGEYGYGTISSVTASPALPSPVQVSLSESNVASGMPVTLTWKSLQRVFCDAAAVLLTFVENNAAGSGIWTGLQTGELVDGVYNGSAVITPTETGVYFYVLTCGGSESGYSGALYVNGGKILTSTQLLTTSPVTIGSPVTLKVLHQPLNNPLGRLPVQSRSASTAWFWVRCPYPTALRASILGPRVFPLTLTC